MIQGMGDREDREDRVHLLLAQELEDALAAERRARGDTEILLQALEEFASRPDVDGIVSCLERYLMRLIPHGCSAICFFASASSVDFRYSFASRPAYSGNGALDCACAIN